MDPEQFAALIAETIKKSLTPEPAPAPEAPVQKAATLDDVQKLLVASFAEFGKAIDAKIEKATTYSREGIGRLGSVASTPESERDADPLKYIVKKAQSGEEGLDMTDKILIAELTTRVLTDGMLYSPSDN